MLCGDRAWRRPSLPCTHLPVIRLAVRPWAPRVPTESSAVLRANADQSLSKFVTTYAYEFNDENAPPSQAAFGGLLTFPLGAYHSSELQYLFKGVDVFGLPVTLSHKQNATLRCDGQLLDAVREDGRSELLR